MSALVDPHLLVETSPQSKTDEEAFWQRVVAIAGAKHIQIGHEGFHWVIQQLQALGYPAQRIDFGPRDFGRECQSAIESILSRISRGNQTASEVDFRPEYIAGTDVALALAMDLTEHGGSIHSLMSDHTHWAERSTFVDVGEMRVELLLHPAQKPKAADDEAIKSWFASRRIHVLGGSPTSLLLASIGDSLGVSLDQIHWVESEASKPPRNLDKAWSGLKPERDVALCNTARIGHKSWEKGDKAAKGCGVTMLECSGHGLIVSTLRNWALKEIDRERIEKKLER